MPGPLSGYRVVDLTSNVAGPLATMILADQGADVIKVEAPDGGDHTRAAANRRAGFSASFLNNNRNKRSIVLDLKTPPGLEALLRLCATADAFVQNFRPGVAERLGAGESAIRAVAPKIVYVSISGFGEKGPFAAKPAYDPVIQGFSGLATVQAGSDAARPRLLRTILPDKLTAITASQAITAALLARERTGEGQHVRLSMLDAVLAFLWSSDMGGQTFVGGEPVRQEAASTIDLIYETADGYLTLAALTDRQWQALSETLDRPEWLDRPALSDPGPASTEYRRAARSDTAGVAGAPRRRMAGKADRRRHPVRPGADPQSGHPSSAADRDGQHRRDRAPEGRPAAPGAAPPRGFRAPRPKFAAARPVLASTREEILAGLGYSEDEIAGLKADGVIAG